MVTEWEPTVSRLPGGYAFGGTGPMGEVVGERNGRDTGVERGCTGAHQTKDANRFTLIRSRLKKLGVILMKLYFEAEKYLSAKGGGLQQQTPFLLSKTYLCSCIFYDEIQAVSRRGDQKEQNTTIF